MDRDPFLAFVIVGVIHCCVTKHCKTQWLKTIAAIYFAPESAIWAGLSQWRQLIIEPSGKFPVNWVGAGVGG